MTPIVCSICGKEFVVAFEVRGQGKTFLVPNPKRIRHCENGNHVDVAGTITGFYEKIDGNLVAAKPVLGDPLEG